MEEDRSPERNGDEIDFPRRTSSGRRVALQLPERRRVTSDGDNDSRHRLNSGGRGGGGENQPLLGARRSAGDEGRTYSGDIQGGRFDGGNDDGNDTSYSVDYDSDCSTCTDVDESLDALEDGSSGDPRLTSTVEIPQSIVGSLKTQRDAELKVDDKEPRPFKQVKPIPFAIAFVISAVLSFVPFWPSFVPYQAQRCFALLVFVAIMWAGEGAPLMVTALFLAIPIVWAGIVSECDSEGGWASLSATKSASVTGGMYFQPVIILFLGGFTIARALFKTGLSTFLGSFFLQFGGSNFKLVLFMFIALGVVMSMWVSNVASALLCTSLATPILRELPAGGPHAKALLLGIAFSNNLGGMSTPIASPQNAIAKAALAQNAMIEVKFAQWMAVALPVVILGAAALWVLLILFYAREKVTVTALEVVPVKLSVEVVIVGVTTVVTVAMWCLEDKTASITGDIGITALIPVAVFFGSGILTTADFHGLAWPVLMLMGGGMALGNAMNTSGLLLLISEGLNFELSRVTPWVMTLVFTLMMLLVGNFISSTVAALVVLPIIASTGAIHDMAPVLVLTSALMCSGAMSLPVSSFPNANSFAVKNREGKQILSAKDYVIMGTVMAFVMLVIIMSVGYLIADSLSWSRIDLDHNTTTTTSEALLHNRALIHSYLSRVDVSGAAATNLTTSTNQTSLLSDTFTLTCSP